MNKYFLACFFAALLVAGNAKSQTKNLNISGYGQVDYNQELNKDEFKEGDLDVHRIVLQFDYRFSDKTNFFSEFEFEHVKEFYVEQAYLQHNLAPYLNLKAGLILVPMGIINEYHEPPTFNGVERPNVDKYVVPTTWREIGIGFSGNIDAADLSYQIYLMNGFKSYAGDNGTLGGSNGLRKGRQKGAESTITSPNLSLKIENYSIKGLSLGLAGYFGKTQSDLYEGKNKSDDAAIASADSSTVGISMIGLDARYNIGKLELRGQYIVSNHSNVEAYNSFTGMDLGKSITGWYLESAYSFGSFEKYGIYKPFVRYEKYNLHATTENIPANGAYNINEFTFGISWHTAYGAAFKVDYALKSNDVASSETRSYFNAGVAIMF